MSRAMFDTLGFVTFLIIGFIVVFALLFDYLQQINLDPDHWKCTTFEISKYNFNKMECTTYVKIEEEVVK